MKRALFILFLINLLFLSPITGNTKEKGIHYSEPLQVSFIAFFNDMNNLSFDQMKRIEADSFKQYNNNELFKDKSYWFRVIIVNEKKSAQDYFIHFNSTFSFIELFQSKEDDSFIVKKGGNLMPQSKRSTKGYIKDKVPFTLMPGKTVLYLKVVNNLEHKYTLNHLQLISETELKGEVANIDFFQGFFQGMMIIIMIVNFIFYFFSKNRLYLYYALYILFTALFFFHSFQFSEKYFLFNHPKADLSLFWSIYVAQSVYLLFFLELLKYEEVSVWRRYVKYYAWMIYFFCALILVIGQIDYHLGIMLSDYYTMLNVIFVISSYFIFRKKAKLTTRIVLAGSVIMVVGATITTVVSFSKVSVTNLSYYQFGVFFELLLFTLAINYTYIKDHLKNVEILYQNSLLELNSIQKEKENRALKEVIDYKNRVLATKAMVLSEKETLISDLIKQLRLLKAGRKANADIQNMIGNLKINLSNNSWDEFEIHFSEIHPQFYSSLNTKYPNLTAGERKLCAFLKLNMSTKDIAAINGKSLNTIDVARGRLRKKMNLNNNENLQVVINSIS